MPSNPQTKIPLPSSVPLSPQYFELFEEIKKRIQTSKTRAALAVNRELILLYYDIGKRILERQEQGGWESQVIDRLSADLKHAFPKARGFSPRNLRYMRTFAEIYPDYAFVQSVIAQIAWGHIVRILHASKDPTERSFYIN